MTHFSRSLRFDSFAAAERTLSALAEAQGFKVERVLSPFDTTYEDQGVASWKCTLCSFFVALVKDNNPDHDVFVEVDGEEPTENWTVYTLNDVHSPICLSRRRVRCRRSVSTVPSAQSSEVELSDESDLDGYDEFGRPNRAYVRSPSLAPPPPRRAKQRAFPSQSLRAPSFPLLPPLASEELSLQPSTTTTTSNDAAGSPPPDPQALSAYLEDLLASLDAPLPAFDASKQEALSTADLLKVVKEPLAGLHESGLKPGAFLNSLDQGQLDDLTPRLSRAISVVQQSINPNDISRPLAVSSSSSTTGSASASASTSVEPQHLAVEMPFGISPALLERQPVASTSSRPYSPNEYDFDHHPYADEAPMILANGQVQDGLYHTNGYGDAAHHHAEDKEDDEEEEDEDDARARQEAFQADMLDRELARAFNSPTPDPPDPDPPDPATGNASASQKGKQRAGEPPDEYFDIYQIFPSYGDAEASILGNGRKESMPLNILWRPNPYIGSSKGACYECVRQCGYEIRLSDDALGKWRVTSVEGAHEKQCYPSFKGKRKAKSERKKPVNPQSRPGAPKAVGRGLSPISSRARRARSLSRSSSPSITVVAKSDTYIKTIRVSNARDARYSTSPISSSPPKPSPATQRGKQKRYANGFEYIYQVGDSNVHGSSPEKPIELDEDGNDSEERERIRFARAANGESAMPTKPNRRRPYSRTSRTKPVQQDRASEDPPATIKTSTGQDYAFSRKRLPTTYGLRKAVKPLPQFEEQSKDAEFTPRTRSSKRRRKYASPAYKTRRLSQKQPPVLPDYTNGDGHLEVDDNLPPPSPVRLSASYSPLPAPTAASGSTSASKAMPSLQTSMHLPLLLRPHQKHTLSDIGYSPALCAILSLGGFRTVRHLVGEGLVCNKRDFELFRDAFHTISAYLQVASKHRVMRAVREVVFEIRVRASIQYEINGEMDEASLDENENAGEERPLAPLPAATTPAPVTTTSKRVADSDSDIEFIPTPKKPKLDSPAKPKQAYNPAREGHQVVERGKSSSSSDRVPHGHQAPAVMQVRPSLTKPLSRTELKINGHPAGPGGKAKHATPQKKYHIVEATTLDGVKVNPKSKPEVLEIPSDSSGDEEGYDSDASVQMLLVK